MSNWKLIAPTATTNLCTNPSFEASTAGWTVSGTNTLARSSAQSWAGNYSALITYQDNTALAVFPITLPTASTTYILHCRLYVSSNWDGGNISLTQTDLTSATTTVSNQYTDGTDATATWLYIETTLAADSDVTGNIVLSTSSAPTAGRTVYMDAFQIEELATATTYCDGEQDGCRWDGQRHLSTSTRDVTSRAGGTLKDFQTDYSVYIERLVGTGMAPVNNVTSSRALLPGREHQRAHVGARFFSLLHTIIGTSISNLHSLRQALLAVISPDAVPGDQPVIIQYDGAATKKQIQAHYDGGLEMSYTSERGFTEQIGLRFLAADPFWTGLGEEKADLSPTSATVRLLVGRRRGTWNDFGPPSATTGSYTDLRSIVVEHDKSIYVGGTFTDFDDVAAADYIAHWDGTSWEAVGTPNTGAASISGLLGMAQGTDGVLYVVGTFTNLADVAAADYIAQWSGSAWTAVGTPSTSASITTVWACDVGYDGNLYVAGNFTSLEGVTNADYASYWDGTNWNAMGSGLSSIAYTVAASPDGNIYYGGAFTTAGGTAVTRTAYWDGSAWNAMGSGLNAQVNKMVVGPDGTVYATGQFTANGSGDTINRVARFNGTEWEPLGTGLNGTGHALAIDSNGLLYVSGAFTQAGRLTTADRVAVWDGSAWRSPPLDLPGSPNVYAMATAGVDDIYIGFDTTGTAYFSSPTSASNSGTAAAYPVITVRRDGGSTTLLLEEIVNITTGRRLLFDLSLQDGQEYIIDLRPGKRSMKTNKGGAGASSEGFVSNWEMLPGSDVTDFFLIPGTNSLAVYTSPSAPSQLSCFVRWVPAYWSID